MSFTNKPWDGSDSRFSVEQLLASVPHAIAAWAREKAKAEGREVLKSDLRLPIREPDGIVNVNALRNALARASQVEGVPAEVISAAKTEIEDLLAKANASNGESSHDAWALSTDEYRKINSLVGVLGNVPICEALQFSPIPTSLPAAPKQPLTGAKSKIIIANVGRSKNKNIYRNEVLAKSVPKFEGAKVFYNHKGDDRDFRDLAGEIRGVAMEGDRMVATLEVLEADQWLRKLIVEKPHLVGLSLYCWASSTPTEEGELIEEIQAVRSVDIVDSPAAGGGVINVLENTKTDIPIDTLPVNAYESRKEPTVDEKQFAEKVASLEKSVSEKDIALAEAQKSIEALKAEKKELADKLAAIERHELVESFLASKRAAGMKQSVEAAIRRAVQGAVAVTKESLEALTAEWTKVAEEIAKDYAPAVAPAPAVAAPADNKPVAGLPPRTAPKAEAAAEAAKPSGAKDFAHKLVNGLFGVKATS